MFNYHVVKGIGITEEKITGSAALMTGPEPQERPAIQ